MHLVGFQWEDAIFADRVLPMGLRSSSQICQRVISAVVFMYFNMGFKAFIICTILVVLKFQTGH
jgi:hypothetical protein